MAPTSDYVAITIISHLRVNIKSTLNILVPESAPGIAKPEMKGAYVICPGLTNFYLFQKASPILYSRDNAKQLSNAVLFSFWAHRRKTRCTLTPLEQLNSGQYDA